MKKILLVLFIISGFIFSCGSPSWRAEGKEAELDLKPSDWQLDENGHFIKCPEIPGCDDDGDCIMNVDDPFVDVADEWREVCTNKYSEEDSLNLCMSDYSEEYDSCVGGDFEEMRSFSSAPTLGEYFKNDLEVLAVLAESLAMNFGDLLDLGAAESLLKANLEAKNTGVFSYLGGNILAFLKALVTLGTLGIVKFDKKSDDGGDPDAAPGQGEADKAGSADSKAKCTFTLEADKPQLFDSKEYGKDGLRGAYKYDAFVGPAADKTGEIETCLDAGNIQFNKADPVESEGISSHYTSISSKPNKCDSVSFNKNASSAIKGEKLIIVATQKEDSEPTMKTTGKFTKFSYQLKPTATEHVIVVNEVGCYPIGGRGTNPTIGEPVTYPNMAELIKAEKENCKNYFEKKYEKCKFECEENDKKTELHGVIQKFSLYGQGAKGETCTKIKAEKIAQAKFEDQTVKSPNLPACFTGGKNNINYAMIQAKITNPEDEGCKREKYDEVEEFEIVLGEDLEGKDSVPPSQQSSGGE